MLTFGFTPSNKNKIVPKNLKITPKYTMIYFYRKEFVIFENESLFCEAFKKKTRDPYSKNIKYLKSKIKLILKKDLNQ